MELGILCPYQTGEHMLAFSSYLSIRIEYASFQRWINAGPYLSEL